MNQTPVDPDEEAIPELMPEFTHTAAEINAALVRLAAPISGAKAARLAASRGVSLEEFFSGRAEAVKYWLAHKADMQRHGVWF